MATKAKELGYTVDEIEKVMNSAYIYIPYLTEFTEKKEKNSANITLKGGIIWFQVVMKDNKPTVKLRVKKSTKSSGFGSEKFALQSAAMNFARNLLVATQSMPEFRLSSTIAEVEGKNITFSLGKKEGIKIDNCFFVGEWMEDDEGALHFKKAAGLELEQLLTTRKTIMCDPLRGQLKRDRGRLG